jgi:hypothetical protein
VALLVAIVAALFWPGLPMYDTVAQYGQVLSGEVDDWHPPIMVRLWQLMQPLGGGTAPMFVLQVALYAAGFALIVAALVRSGRWRAAVATAALALSPLLLGWQMVVLKDAEMLGALLLGFGIVAQYRLAQRRVPISASAVVVVLIAYATLVRANALFATIPLAAVLLPRPAGMVAKAGAAIVIMVALLAAEPLINDRLFGAEPSGVAKSQPMFDLAAIAVATPRPLAPFTPAEREQLIRRHCAKAFFWDPVTDPSACGPVTSGAMSLPERELYLDLARAVTAHPVAYAEHRLEHWNSTERWLIPPGRLGAEPPDEAEPNDAGLATPTGPFVPLWQDAAAFEAQTPLGWPIVWTALGLLLLPVAWRRRTETTGGLALALLVSSLALEASFLVISIASDLRYHLWSMTAAALALILLSDALRVIRREMIPAALVLVLIIAGGVLTRVALPAAPDSYQAMLHAPDG